MQKNESTSSPKQQSPKGQLSDVPKTPETPTPVSEMSKKSPNWIIISVVVLLLGIIGILSFQNYQLKLQVLQKESTSLPKSADELKTSSPASTIGPIADWKTYENEDYGFSLKYPVVWNIYETITVPNIIGFSISEDRRADIWVSVHDNEKNLSAEDWWNEYITTAEDQYNVLNRAEKKQVTVGDRKGYLVLYSKESPRGDYFAWTYLVNNSKTYEIWVKYKDEEKYTLYNQILSTLQFTN